MKHDDETCLIELAWTAFKQGFMELMPALLTVILLMVGVAVYPLIPEGWIGKGLMWIVGGVGILLLWGAMSGPGRAGTINARRRR
ncbi:MAG: hypothetical protein [Bacteriophage sp.]|nr:MAG: hypothetical protein [Bacteriophage sp.]